MSDKQHTGLKTGVCSSQYSSNTQPVWKISTGLEADARILVKIWSWKKREYLLLEVIIVVDTINTFADALLTLLQCHI